MQEIKNKFEILEKNILEKLNNSEIKMKPKWHFVLKSLAILLSAIFLLLLSVFFFSFVIFENRMLPPHAMREVFMNMQILPFILITILLFISGIIFILHTKYNFIYKKPAYIIISSLLFLILISSFFIDKFLMHDRIKDRLEKRPMPFMRDMYRDDFVKGKMDQREDGKRREDIKNTKFEIK